jgi:hypothetical protein
MRMNKVLASVASLMLVLSPLNVYADDTVYATDNNGNNYMSINAAWNAACNGVEITMQADWNLEDRLIVPDSAKAVVEMNGHRISRNLGDDTTNGEVLCLNDNSTLNLMGLNAPETEFSFKGYSRYNSTQDVSLTSGGLITGGYSSNGGGGIYMKKGSSLTLNHIIVGGNKSEKSLQMDGNGGGICIDGDNTNCNFQYSYVAYNFADLNGGGIYSNSENSMIILTGSHINNNSTYCYTNYHTKNGGGLYIDKDSTALSMRDSEIKLNYAYGDGGGLFINGEYAKVSMDNSHIDENTSHEGGGININDTNCSIEMKNNSSINKNKGSLGGGVYINYSYFSIQSKDDTQNTISENTISASGAGIYINSNTLNSNSGEILGMIIDSNVSGSYSEGTNMGGSNGGGLYINQENVLVKNCTITNNKCSHGGGVYIDNDNVTFEDTTVTNNSSWNKWGSFYVSNTNDITLNGKIIIKNNEGKQSDLRGANHIGDGDLELGEGDTMDSYIKGNLSSDSEIGLYMSNVRKIAIEQTSDNTSVFFFNYGISHLEYNADEQAYYLVSGSATSSVFGDGNTLIAGCVMVAVVAVGVVCLVVHKKRTVK